MTITYRIATTDDIPLLAAMNRELIEDEGSRTRLTGAELADRMRDWLQGEYSAALFETDGETVAYALWRGEGDAIYLRQFFVQRASRRKGFGRICMESLLRDTLQHKRIILEVLTTNPGALAFWKSTGFNEYAVTLERNPV